jgi:hypothetical protein
MSQNQPLYRTADLCDDPDGIAVAAGKLDI